MKPRLSTLRVERMPRGAGEYRAALDRPAGTFGFGVEIKRTVPKPPRIRLAHLTKNGFRI